MTKVVGRIKQWHDFLANNSGCGYSLIPHKQRATPSSTPVESATLAIELPLRLDKRLF
jgi:hypothetical protein